MTGIDWSVELRRAERAFDGLPPEPSADELRARRAAELREQERREQGAAAVGVWFRLALVVGLAVALHWWPYPRRCGPGLLGFMGAESLIVAGGLWVVACTWRWRMARTHGLAFAVMLFGLAALAAEILPRVGYAKVNPADPPAWRCTR